LIVPKFPYVQNLHKRIEKAIVELQQNVFMV
jgi:hypothetical protein